MAETSENTRKLIQFIGLKYQKGELDNDSLVQIIELCDSFLNLQTISNYAKTENISYNGAKRFRKPAIEINKVKFIINNS